MLEVLSLAGELTAGMKAALKKNADELLKSRDEIIKVLDDSERYHVLNLIDELAERGAKGADKSKSFAGLAKIKDLQDYLPNGKVIGQGKEYTCVASSFRMVLDDIGIIRSEDFLASALNTTKDGANILDISKAIKNIYADGVKVIARGGTKDKNVKLSTLVNQFKNAKDGRKAIVSVNTEELGRHAIVVDKIENGRVFIRDPYPPLNGSAYSLSINDFSEIFNKKFITIIK